MRSAWYSLRYPSLHGITDQLIALAMLGAWATGDLLTAALLPIIMIFGHVLEERSVIGSQEAIHALGQLTRSHARKVQADGSIRRSRQQHPQGRVTGWRCSAGVISVRRPMATV